MSMKLIYENVLLKDKIERTTNDLEKLLAHFKPCSICHDMLPVESMKDDVCAHCQDAQIKLNMIEWNKMAGELCYEIEKLPASPEQTELSIKASNLAHAINKKLYPAQ